MGAGLTDARRLFGQAGTPYDWATVDIPTLKDRARELEGSQAGLQRKVNPKVLAMIDTCVRLNTTRRS